MKRANYLLQEIADLDNLRLASWKAAKGKRFKREVQAYQADLDENLLALQSQILEGNVEVGAYHYFTIYEPKKRNICASAFREQVLHHGIMNICHEVFEKYQIYDSYASRKGKGVYAALERAQHYSRKYERYLKLDIRKFFDSIDHQVLKSQINRLFKEERLLSMLFQIIDSYEDSDAKGVPIGNLTSQYFANHYLATLDHYIKGNLKCKAYVRYMDDFVLWANSSSEILAYKEAIASFIQQKLQCELKHAFSNRTSKGLPFLGYRAFPYQVRLLRKSKIRYIKKLRKAFSKELSGEWSESKCQRKTLPLIAFVNQADSSMFKKSLPLEQWGLSQGR